MVNHKSLKESDFWAPPGGGLEFSETIADTLKREFREEVNLEVQPGKFLFGCEYIHDPLHAIELFFEASKPVGELKTGNDPELAIIREASFLSLKEIKALPPDHVHGIFKLVRDATDLHALHGFYKL
jgi:8-oxo-dGTP diphosphatase